MFSENKHLTIDPIRNIKSFWELVEVESSEKDTKHWEEGA